MHGLALRHKPIAELIGEREVDYLDIPCHENIGDLLIFLGTLKFLSTSGIDVRIMRPSFGYQPPRIISGKGTAILLHGGGNFGDLYPTHQKFREEIIARHRMSRIIILPQTVFFHTPSALKSTRESFRDHPDLHIFVRDRESLRIARTLCRNSALMPDMAHQLFPIMAPSGLGIGRSLNLYRSDKESAFRLDQCRRQPAEPTIDWSNIVPISQVIRRKLLRLLGKAGSEFATELLMREMERSAISLAKSAVTLFAQHEHISTDRLHAHILACLIGIPSTTADNSYGKNFSYIDTWTGHSPIVHKLYR